jgi:serine/threonine-protein kinase
VDSIGGYTIQGKLGEGGMGVVYRATHPASPGRVFAVKVLQPDESQAPAGLARFEREIQALRVATAHPNVVRILDGSIDPKAPWIAMELVEGRSLHELAWQKPFEPRRAVAILLQVCEAVAFVHAQGIIHRDLKPANVLVEEGDRPRVCDFGLARLENEERLTQSGLVLGSIAWQAPEQLRNFHSADARSDVYALGAILYFLLTGRPPIPHGNPRVLITRIVNEKPIAPSVLEPSVPPELAAIVLRALEKDPAMRQPTATALRDDLARWSSPTATAPRDDLALGTSPPAPSRKVLVGTRAILIGAACLLLGLVALALAILAR